MAHMNTAPEYLPQSSWVTAAMARYGDTEFRGKNRQLHYLELLFQLLEQDEQLLQAQNLLQICVTNMTKSEEHVCGDTLGCVECITDEKLSQAIEECFRNQSCLPIIKQELQCAIQYKRLDKGLDELQLIPEEPPVYLLRSDEVRKRHKRRLQNRASSVRCRQRKNEYIRELEQRVGTLETNQIILKAEVASLENEKDRLQKFSASHMSVCSSKSRSNQQRNIGRKMVSLLNPKYLSKGLKT